MPTSTTMQMATIIATAPCWRCTDCVLHCLRLAIPFSSTVVCATNALPCSTARCSTARSSAAATRANTNSKYIACCRRLYERPVIAANRTAGCLAIYPRHWVRVKGGIWINGLLSLGSIHRLTKMLVKDWRLGGAASKNHWRKQCGKNEFNCECTHDYLLISSQSRRWNFSALDLPHLD